MFAVKSLTDTECIVDVQMETAKLSAETLFEDCSQLARREVPLHVMQTACRITSAKNAMYMPNVVFVQCGQT